MIADKTYIYRGAFIHPGDELPEEIAEKIESASVEEEPAAEAGDLNPLEEMSVDDLRELVERREITVEGTGKNGNVVKADLIRALEGE